jgi:hypothetical protein
VQTEEKKEGKHAEKSVQKECFSTKIKKNIKKSLQKRKSCCIVVELSCQQVFFSSGKTS